MDPDVKRNVSNASEIQISSDPLDDLNANERASVTGMLNGLTPQEALAKKGTTSSLAVAQFLARDPVRRAIQSLAPLLPDTKHAATLLAPYALAGSVARLNGASPSQALLASRDILALAGLSPGHNSTIVHATARDLIDALRMRTDTESVATGRKGAKRLGPVGACNVGVPRLPATVDVTGGNEGEGD